MFFLSSSLLLDCELYFYKFMTSASLMAYIFVLRSWHIFTYINAFSSPFILYLVLHLDARTCGLNQHILENWGGTPKYVVMM